MARLRISSKALRERLSSMLVGRGGLLGVVAACAYIWLAPRHIIDGDNAEFATLGAIGGGAHPSGYPLYLVWLRAMQWIPGATPAHTAAIATAILAALAVVVLHAACRAWGARVFGATVAAAVFGAAPVVLRISSEAEVFALNNLVVASVLWLSAERGPARGVMRAAALAALAGLGLSNHMTCALVAPIGILGIVRAVRESSPSRALPAAAGALVLGLVPYTYLLATGDTPLSWGTVDSLGELVAAITRQDYGGPGAFLPTGEDPSALTQIAALGAMLARTWLGVGLVAGLVMLGIAVARPRADREPRWGWLMLAVSFVVAGPLLVTRFNLEPVGLGLYVCQRFYVLPALLLAIPVAVALAPVDRLVDRSRFGERGASVLVATVGIVALVALALPQLVRVHTPAVEQYARNLLTSMPRDAVLFVGQDDEYLGVGYLQWARGMRTDVTAVAPQLTAHDWYRDRVARRGVVARDGNEPPIVRVVDHLLASGRPVFVEKARAEIIGAFPTYPYATVMKVLPRGTPVPAVDAVIAENEALFAAFRFDYARPGLDDEFATVVHQRYAATWTTLARKAQSLGKPELAGRAIALANALAPVP